VSEYHLRQNFPTYEDLAEYVGKLHEVLDECATYFDQRSDISDETNEDGSPRPNKEMQMLTMIEEVM
jgi:hypothetical protein